MGYNSERKLLIPVFRLTHTTYKDTETVIQYYQMSWWSEWLFKGPQFKAQPGDWPLWQMVLVVFPSPSRQM